MKHAENSPERTWIIMIIIGEKINGAIPSIKKAIAEHDEALITIHKGYGILVLSKDRR